MAKTNVCIVLAKISLVALFPLCMCNQTNESTSTTASLSPQFYDNSCPKAQAIVQSFVAKAYSDDPRMAASLLRLHFHDCFVNGCDGSVLLDNSETMESEKRSEPNQNSARGFEVIDDIKSALENECPQTVSCADILAIVARDSTVITGGPSWEVYLGRRDAREANLHGSNYNIPSPNSTIQTMANKFYLQGLDLTDLVALLGGHTIGNSRCTRFKQRLYNHSGNSDLDRSLNKNYASMLQKGCLISGDDQNLFALDYARPTKFGNYYFKNLVTYKGLLSSDEILFTKSRDSMELVKLYA
ncbi:unnamed protein product [Arabis nemorensis]|uniref:Peroxidase n=1 Tax=Arabis nemorensis TaxID=586526 RepID=A0A565BV88_9BRAS|nr:unnamed protein product [Arabis nemorensis]